MPITQRFGQKHAMAAPASAHGVLSSHPMFSFLSEDILRNLTARGSLVRIPKYSLLFHQGDEITALYLILDGLVKIYRNLGDADRTIGFLYKSDIVGMESLYSEAGHPYSAQALGAVNACALPREVVQNLAATSAEFNAALLRESARFVEAALHEQDVLAHRSTNGRVAEKIIQLADKFGRTEPHGVVLQLRITQRELASMAGTNRESVCKALVAFSREGSIDVQNKLIVVKNRSKLAYWP